MDVELVGHLAKSKRADEKMFCFQERKIINTNEEKKSSKSKLLCILTEFKLLAYQMNSNYKTHFPQWS